MVDRLPSLSPEAREHARRAAAAAPPMTPAQARRIGQLLYGGVSKPGPSKALPVGYRHGSAEASIRFAMVEDLSVCAICGTPRAYHVSPQAGHMHEPIPQAEAEMIRSRYEAQIRELETTP